jgi:hypothetical protein
VTTTNRYKGSATKILALDQPNGVEVEQMLAGIGPRADESNRRKSRFRPAPQAAAMRHYSWTNNRQPVFSAGPPGPPE